jgi:choline dehydrogenase-like flavoprotein
VEALVFLVKRSRLFLKNWIRSKKGKIVPLRDYSETGDDSDLQNERKSALEWLGLFFMVLFNLPQVLQYLFFRLLKRSGPRIKSVRLRNFMEMEPHPDNRVILGEEQDVYGQPVPVVQHRCTSLDRRSLKLLHEFLVDEVDQNSLGRLSTDLATEEPWPIDLDASHHMGTTRMGDDPKSSVVNRDGRLHTMNNVYLAGGSVFPTSGCANPTFTIVALAVRLAEHLTDNVFKARNKG